MPGWSPVCFRSLRKRQQIVHEHHLDPPENMLLTVEESHSFISESKRGISVVELLKIEGKTLGLIISGGIDKGAPPKICNLRPESIAYRSDALAVGDHIISVNGIRTSKLRHEEIVNLLKNAEGKVILELEYEIPPTSSELSMCIYPKVIQVKILKENGSFGFILRGGACTEKTKSRPLTVMHVRPSGPVDREGTIKAGDRVLAVNNINLMSATLQDAMTILKQIEEEALISIEYDISVIAAVHNASGPLLVEIDKTPYSQLGITINQISELNGSIVIENIKQASIAERCGALHVGDHILAIDGIKIDGMPLVEVMQLLNTSLEIIKLEILPANCTLCKLQLTTPKKGGHSVSHSSMWKVSEFSSYKQSKCGKREEKKHLSNNGIRHVSNNSLLSTTKASCLAFSGHVFHTENLEVSIYANHEGFGFQLEGATFTTELMSIPLIISSIDANGPAERTGVIQVGDRVLTVNGKSTKGLTAEEVMGLIQQLHPQITLVVEFDVAESFVPSSGIFIIKLAKRSGGLGITVSSAKKTLSDDPLIISEIRKGSVAHRIGTIQPGDKLLAINSIHTKNCSVEDAAEIIESCKDIVLLQIQKDDYFSEESGINGPVLYSLELVRHGGPLGITISGTEEPFDPIVITSITEGGLAERTEALHAGDRLIAINGQSLRGKRLSEAISMLQNSGDLINLKISKYPLRHKILPLKEKQDEAINITCISDLVSPLPSVDSAVESWDSCAFDFSFSATNCFESNTSNKAGKGKISRENNALNEWNIGEWDAKTNSAQNSYSYPTSPSPTSESDKGDWSLVLEDLESCGQSQLLRQIEQSIMGSNSAVSGIQHCDFLKTVPSSSYDCSTRHLRLLQRENIDDQNSHINFFKTGDEINTKSCVEQQMNISTFTASECLENRHIGIDSFLPLDASMKESCSLPMPIEIHNVTLFKDQVYEDFGFSVSDGLYDRGVYVNCIRRGGPADLSCLLQPFDRILQVNDTKTNDFDCCLAVPLITSSENKINLIVSRIPYGNHYSLGWNNSFPSWINDRENDEYIASASFNNSLQSLTKTL